METLAYENYIQKLRTDITLELVEVRERIEEEVFQSILDLRELAAIIGETPDLEVAEFNRKAAEYLAKNPQVINVAVAPDLVISMVYPLEGNESALGLNYRDNEAQIEQVEEAMRTGKGVLTGPVDLVQGGRGVILRQPVFLPPLAEAPDVPRPWGILSIVLNYDDFLVSLGVPELQERFNLLLIEPGNDGKPEQIMLGSPDEMGADPIRLNFDFPFGQWELCATPKGGWPLTRPRYEEQWLLRFAFIALTLLGISYIMRLAAKRRAAEVRLRNGIEALDHGIVMFGPDRRVTLYNRRYLDMTGSEQKVEVGTPYQDIMRENLLGGVVPEAVGHEDEFITDWLEHRVLEGGADTEQHLPDGRIIKTSDRLMEDGSIVGLRLDVTEMKKAQIAAEAANQAKTDFMGVLSHELRTPMTVILGHVRLGRNFDRMGPARELRKAIDEGVTDPAELSERVDAVFAQVSRTMETLERSGDHLLTLINEVLDFAKIDSGSLSVSAEQTDVETVVNPVADQLRPMLEQKGLAFNLKIEPGSLTADIKRVQQVLINLIGNASKFTDNGSVTLAARVTDDDVNFDVTDTGVGIPANEIDRVFEPFHQVDGTATRKHGGTGLGLAISRDIAQAHGGSLSVASEPGKGSTFTLSLPRQVCAAVRLTGRPELVAE
ncbi:MAG: ATPase [Rhodobacteraceae bacterium]|nr:ATPase [Paracoccaceae bacterium]